MSVKRPEKCIDYLFPAAVLFFCIARQMLAVGMPVYVRGSTCDDRLMIEMAAGLSKGQWLGDYSALTLMKGCFYPLFVAATYKNGIPTLYAITGLHTLACVFFVLELRPLIRKPWKCLVLLVLILFEPASFAARSFQADYRNSLTILQVLFLFGAVFGLYLNYAGSRMRDFLKSFFIGLVLLSFWNTREDAIWVLPFVLVGLITVLIKAVYLCGPERRRSKILFSVVLCVLPFAVLFGGNELIRQKNKAVYGLPILLETSEGKFADALRSIYSVRNEEEIEFVSVTGKKLDRLYAVSPSLQSISAELDRHIKNYDMIDRHPGDGEVEDGWFLWALRRSAFDAGKTRSLADAESFYNAVSEEIESALNEPSNGLQRIRTMPSALMSPWRTGYLKLLPKGMAEGWIMTAFMQDTQPSAEATVVSDDHADLVERLTGGYVVRADDTDSETRMKAETACARADRLGNLYLKIMPPVTVLALLLFPVILIIEIIKKKLNRDYYLIMAGLLLSDAVMLAGIGYTEITAFTALRCTYLAGAYPLTLVCIVLTYFEAFEAMKNHDTGIK